MAQTQIEFGVLGPLQLSVDSTPMRLGTPKQRVMLAMLLINRNRPVGVDALITAAWEQRPPPGARATIHSYISNLRKLLHNAGVDSRVVLASAPPGYQLSVPDDQLDLGRFITEKSAGAHAAAAGRFDEASRHFSAALQQWRGPVLDDLRDYEFVNAFAAALTEDKVAMHRARAEAEIACGRAQTVIGELETLTGEFPYREPLWEQLITAYYLLGRQADALDAFRRVKTTLADDLGVDPNPRLRELNARILRQEDLGAKKAAKRTATATVVQLGQRTTVTSPSAAAHLRDSSGRCFPLHGAATRIGRSDDNDVVLDDVRVSRHHAIVIDTGSSFVVTDLRSANGVKVGRERIHASAMLADGDCIHISDHEFTFKLGPA
ncbi:BTAD domain-containing putative transcriptional regulator [Mycobacterium sp. IDR2000157661]|uniref:BTAD domain-containing putative transcriptional regulator n=1 Tax=Mycobacterium sp. IDR2000157661 TaxID=2867005 RepID=UPI001EEA910B|nr:BTAD domain-containing putative transcriptional regulator [Mycobacterium sp. IDR2000157661]ULE32079.1 FHA domain-containing protein [Mycobacterium sp. IDR2000157661]